MYKRMFNEKVQEFSVGDYVLVSIPTKRGKYSGEVTKVVKGNRYAGTDTYYLVDIGERTPIKVNTWDDIEPLENAEDYL